MADLSLDILSDDEHTPQGSSFDLKEPHKDNRLTEFGHDLTLVDHSTPTPEEFHNSTAKVLQPPPEEKPPQIEQLYGLSNYVPPARIVVTSWKIRQYSMLAKATKSGVILFQYNADSTLSSIISEIKELLNGQKVISMAYITHGHPGSMYITTEKVVTLQNIKEDAEIKEFFGVLATEVIESNNSGAHLDLLASTLTSSTDCQLVVTALHEFVKIPVNVCKDILGNDAKRQDMNGNTINLGELYFDPVLLRSWSGSVGTQSISNYEKIRTIGRGAYGTAVLYRKKDDDSLVVLKEISILELNATERQAAMNEVKVLGMLSHPNIISYYDSFDEDGTLMIEMEYADGGTLHDFLGKQENDLDEKEILILFSQMVSAIKYCHDINILHRDLKTQNIFLTQDAQVKLGDFGIAKIMTTHNAGNFTVVGTPYYISPEMCEGKPYDNKSDIWALGCILYEMANLTKTFDGTNLPALITKIVKGTFAPIKETYTPEFRLLVRDLLQKDPSLRPDAEEILYNRLAELLQRYDYSDDNGENQSFNYGRTRSLLYYCDVTDMQLYPILDLPVKIQITEASVGLGHVVAVSLERGIYTWGDNSFGQLGHGDVEPREKASEVVLLRGKSIMRALCGDYFTTFLSDNGLILTCGQGEYGCLGHGDWNTLTRPKLVDELLTLDIVSLRTGSYHQAITTAEGEVFTWGCGESGRLGHGNEDDYCLPTKVNFSTEHVVIRDVQCSNDGTVFIGDTGCVFACGRNQGNKLGLNPRQGFFWQFRSKANKYVDYAIEPAMVKDLCRYQLKDIKFGATHFAIVNEFGHVYTNGNNIEGQLGIGNTKPRETISFVKGLEGGPVSIIASGSTFSFAGIQDTAGKNTINSVYFWGTKPGSKRNRTISASDSFSLSRSAKSRKTTFDEDSSVSDLENLGVKGADLDISSNSSRKMSVPETYRRPPTERRPTTDRRSAGSDTNRPRTRSLFDEIGDNEMDEIRWSYLRSCFKGANTQTLNLESRENSAVVIPQLTFKFQSIGGIEGYDEAEEFPVILQDIKCNLDHVLIHLETTAPPPKTHKPKQQKSLDSSNSSNPKEESSEASEMETTGEIPTWIKNELESGIPLNGDNSLPTIPEPVYIDDSGNVSDDEKSLKEPAAEKKKIPFQNVRTRSFDTLSRRGSTLSRDPNFNLVPKLKKMGSMLRIKEDANLSETRIIDGVSVTTSVAEIKPSPLASEDQTDENNNLKKDATVLPKPPLSSSPSIHRKAEITGKTTDTVEYTTVQNIAIHGDSSDSSPPTPKTSPKSPKKQKEKIPLSKARIKRTQQNRERTEAALKEERLSSASDIEDRRERKKIKKKDDEEVRQTCIPITAFHTATG